MTTLDELKQLIHDKFGVPLDDLKPDTPLAEYGLDSLSLVELVFAVEEHFNLDFPDDRQDVNTLTGFAALIDEVKAAKAQ